MRTTILFTLSILLSTSVFCAEEKYSAPELSLKEAKNYSKPNIKHEKWSPEGNLESPRTREIASEKKKKGRTPSSEKQLFKPWIYKATPH